VAKKKSKSIETSVTYPAAAAQGMTTSNLTLVFFKGGLAARTLQVPLGWIHRLGLWLVLGALILVSSIAVSGRLYYLHKKSPATEVPILKQTISSLEQNLKATQAELDALKNPPMTVASSVPAGALQEAGTTHPLDITLFKKQATTAPVTDQNIQIQNLKTQKSAKNVVLNFSIQYTKTDGGNQQGRIIVLAYGQDIFLTYPDTVLQRPGAPQLLDWNLGESFSVSRFREVTTTFPQIKAIKELQILLFDSRGRLLIEQKVPVL
jgi:hypothetical protein